MKRLIVLAIFLLALAGVTTILVVHTSISSTPRNNKFLIEEKVRLFDYPEIVGTIKQLPCSGNGWMYNVRVIQPKDGSPASFNYYEPELRPYRESIYKTEKDSKILGETPAELKDKVKALTSEVNTLFSQLYESEYNHRIKQAKATLDEELKLYKDSFEGQRLARKKHYLAVAAINKEFAEKRAEEIKREVEAEVQSVEQRLAEIEKEQEEYRKEIEAVVEDVQQSLQVIEEIEDLKVEALGKGFAKQLAEIDRWRDKQLDKYRDWKEAEVLIELIAQQRRREIIEEYQKKADEDREKADEDREAEIEKTRTSVEEAIDEINSAYEEDADRMKSVTEPFKTSFEELINIC